MISFNQLIRKITRAIQLTDNNKYIEAINFRKPIILNKSLKFKYMEIWGKDDVYDMFDYIYQIGSINCMKIYIKIIYRANVMSKDDEVGPFETNFEINVKQYEEQNANTDDYNLYNSVKGRSNNIGDADLEDKAQNENEDDDNDSCTSTEDDDNGEEDALSPC